jgi:signal transduction histidine kinase
VAGDESAVPSAAEEQAFLVMREAVRNAVVHSGCGCIEVSVDVEDTELRGRVEDDGAGFDPRGSSGGWHDDRGDGEPAAGVGLKSMRERTEALGGRLDVSSEPGGGSAVEVRIPFAD